MASIPPPVPGWVSLCSNLAPLASMAIFMAPMPTLNDVDRKQNVGTLPLLPYSSMIASSFLWTTYGLLIEQPKVWMTNGIGLAFGLFYFQKFVKFAPPKAPSFPGSIKQHIQGCLAIIAATMAITFLPSIPNPSVIVGNIAVVLCLVLFGSPLAALKSVIVNRSAKSIPLPFTLATVINCFLWSVSGLRDLHDATVYFPNLVGLAFGLSQVGLKVAFGDGKQGESEMEPMM